MTARAFSLFQAACVGVVLVTLLAMTRVRAPRAILADYGAIALAGLVGEETCIAFYEFYSYAPEWLFHVHHVPLLVPLIWPLVILSARDVLGALFPALTPGRRALAVALVVLLDATLMEVLSVRAGLWTWVEPGLLGVPIIGLFGWSFFAAATSYALDVVEGLAARVALVVTLGPVVTHALLVTTWWALFRWVGRVDVGAAGIAAYAALSVALTAAALRARTAGRAAPPAIWLPRLAATALFVLVFVTTAWGLSAYAMVFGLAALPHLSALRFSAPPAGSEVDVRG